MRIHKYIALVYLSAFMLCSQVGSVYAQKKLPVEEYETHEDWLGRKKGDSKRKRKKELKAQIKKRKELAKQKSKEAKRAKLAARRGKRAKTAKQENKAPSENRKSRTPKVAKSYASARQKKVNAVVEEAGKYLNTRYKWGGMSHSGVDCSGLLVLAFKSVDMSIPRTSNVQAQQGKKISKANLQPGDMLFFSASTPGKIAHSALVVEIKNGQVKFIHSTSGSGVRYDYLSNVHWSKHYICARRYL